MHSKLVWALLALAQGFKHAIIAWEQRSLQASAGACAKTRPESTNKNNTNLQSMGILSFQQHNAKVVPFVCCPPAEGSLGGQSRRLRDSSPPLLYGRHHPLCILPLAFFHTFENQVAPKANILWYLSLAHEDKKTC